MRMPSRAIVAPVSASSQRFNVSRVRQDSLAVFIHEATSGVYAQPLLGCIEQTQHPFATYHKTTFYTRTCKALHTTYFPAAMAYWAIAAGKRNDDAATEITKPDKDDIDRWSAAT